MMFLHPCRLTCGLTAVGAAATLVGLAAPPIATASADGSLNGRYIATSNGDWAMTNDQYRKQASVRSTWTISSSCANPTDCVGTLTSDVGWTADIYKKAGMWYARHVVPGWRPCPDGTAVDGLQLFTFYAGDPLTGQQSPGSDTYLGDDITTSPSGACGINKQLVIQMPFKLVAA